MLAGRNVVVFLISLKSSPTVCGVLASTRSTFVLRLGGSEALWAGSTFSALQNNAPLVAYIAPPNKELKDWL